MKSYEILDASAPDTWKEVSEFLSTIPLAMALPIRIRRLGPLQEAYPSLGEDTRHLAAYARSANGEIMGFIHGSVDERLLNIKQDSSPVLRRELRRVLYLGDLRISPKYRRQSLGRYLIRHLAARAREEENAELGICFIHQSNLNMMEMIREKDSIVDHIEGLEDLVLSTQLISQRLRTPVREFRRFTPDASSFSILAKFLSDASFSVPRTTSSLQSFANKYDKDLYWYEDIARPGEILGAYWDQRDFKRFELSARPGWLKVADVAWTLLGPMSGASKLPGPSEAFVALERCYYTGDSERARRLERQVALDTRSSGAHMINTIERAIHATPAKRVSSRIDLNAKLVYFAIGSKLRLARPNPTERLFVDAALV